MKQILLLRVYYHFFFFLNKKIKRKDLFLNIQKCNFQKVTHVTLFGEFQTFVLFYRKTSESLLCPSSWEQQFLKGNTSKIRTRDDRREAAATNNGPLSWTSLCTKKHQKQWLINYEEKHFEKAHGPHEILTSFNAY